MSNIKSVKIAKTVIYDLVKSHYATELVGMAITNMSVSSYTGNMTVEFDLTPEFQPELDPEIEPAPPTEL